MKLLLSLFLAMFLVTQLEAQSISKQVIGSSGQSITSGTHTINFTVGESIVGVLENGESIGQGFWAAVASDATLSVETFVNNNTEESINIYPNPASDVIQIKFKLKSATDYQARLFDVSGKEIYNLNKITEAQIKHIRISHLSSGMYILNVKDNKSDYNKSFKILKQ